MHELSLCENIQQIIEHSARVHEFARVKIVRVEIGAFACVEPNALSFHFDIVRAGVARDAMLEIIRVPAQAWCAACNDVSTVAQRYDACPRCGHALTQWITGDELRVKDLEVE